MMNALNNSNETPLWKCITQNQLQMAQIILDIGYADINHLCGNNQTISHLIFELYPDKTGPYHELLSKYKADLTVMDIHGNTPNNITELQKAVLDCEREEKLLYEETMKMREKLKSSRIVNKRKHDKLLSNWLNNHNLNKTAFSDALLIKEIKWSEFVTLSDDKMYEIMQNYCDSM